MTNPFPLGDKKLKIGIPGMKEGSGNAHPFSRSAMMNGYDREVMHKWIGKEFPGKLVN